ncbi:peptidoglycan-binding domain-containing protein [Streptomyces populi]
MINNLLGHPSGTGADRTTGTFMRIRSTIPTRIASAMGALGLAGATVLMAGSNAHASYSAPYVRYGMQGKAVFCVQYGLRQAGLGTVGDLVTTDGVWGPRTDNAVRELQARAGLQVDGVVGRQTGDIIFRAIARDQPANARDCWDYVPTKGGSLINYGILP